MSWSVEDLSMTSLQGWKAKPWSFILCYIILLFAAMGVGACGAINFIIRASSTKYLLYPPLSWVAYVIVVLGAIANVLCIVFFLIIACTSCSRVTVPLPSSKIKPLPLPPGAQPAYSMVMNPSAPYGPTASTSAFSYPSSLPTRQYITLPAPI